MNQSNKGSRCIECERINAWCQTCKLKWRERKYGRCIECQQTNTGQNWCQTCNSKRFQQNFDKWTSGNDDVDKFIQNTQLSAKNAQQVLEWVPYEFNGVKHIAK